MNEQVSIFADEWNPPQHSSHGKGWNGWNSYGPPGGMGGVTGDRKSRGRNHEDWEPRVDAKVEERVKEELLKLRDYERKEREDYELQQQRLNRERYIDEELRHLRESVNMKGMDGKGKGSMEAKGFKGLRKKCFNCSSFSHLAKDCPVYQKKINDAKLVDVIQFTCFIFSFLFYILLKTGVLLP